MSKKKRKEKKKEKALREFNRYLSTTFDDIDFQISENADDTNTKKEERKDSIEEIVEKNAPINKQLIENKEKSIITENEKEHVILNDKNNDINNDENKNKNLIVDNSIDGDKKNKKTIFSLFKKKEKNLYKDININRHVKKHDLKYYKGEKTFNFVKTCQVALVLIMISCVFFAIYKYNVAKSDQENFHAVSLKPFKYVSNKEEAVNAAYANIDKSLNSTNSFSSTNLNLSSVYDTVLDDDEKRDLKNARTNPIPVTMDEEKEKEIEYKSVAAQIYDKLYNRYLVLNKALCNLGDLDPVQIVRMYHYDGYSIIGKFNPEEPSHIKGKRHTYFIKKFSNVNINYYDNDGEELIDNNIKDIMSMASVYSYYHNVYDYDTFLRQSYDLFDNSYSYVASISEVYYCSGCMHYNEPETPHEISYDKITNIHEEQKVLYNEDPYRMGRLIMMPDTNDKVNFGTYEEYINKIKDGTYTSYYNYCPGHVDLDIDVSVLTLSDSEGLTRIDSNFGNKGIYYNKNWHGWDKLMISKAKTLSSRDWEADYGISESDIQYIKPLTEEEVNFYMNRLSDDISPNRKLLIRTALKSVGKIPYYYGGKAFRTGYSQNMFGTKVASDYKGRCLKGLDCSGWVNWVYHTAFSKQIIKTEGTAKLALEGQRITRKELLPGDLIVRPGVDSHVMMFLEWAPNGKIKVIHENGSVNNVSIGTFNAYYPYYRRILNS